LLNFGLNNKDLLQIDAKNESLKEVLETIKGLSTHKLFETINKSLLKINEPSTNTTTEPPPEASPTTLLLKKGLKKPK